MRWLQAYPRSIGTIEIDDKVVRVTEVVNGTIMLGETPRTDDLVVDLVRASRDLDAKCRRPTGHLRSV